MSEEWDIKEVLTWELEDHIREVIVQLQAQLAELPDVKRTMRHWKAKAERQQEQLEAKQQWQPIETAPKDGTLFLGFYKSHGGSQGYIKETWWGPLNESKQGWLLRGLMIDPINKITHWMPLPSPPQALQESDDE